MSPRWHRTHDWHIGGCCCPGPDSAAWPSHPETEHLRCRSSPSSHSRCHIETAHFASRRDLTLHTLTRINATTLTVASRNTGRRDGDEVILLFAAPPNAGVDGAPLKSLVAFERISLAVGASARTELAVGAQHVALARTSGDGALGVERAVATGAWRFWVGPHGQADGVSVEVR